nr:hypothetical protein [Tanacetum cinerariifolium]
MHTSKDDYLINTFRFVSRKEASLKYGVVLPECLTSHLMKESKAYKTYLGYATGTIPPKVARKFKKASPSKKDSENDSEEHESDYEQHTDGSESDSESDQHDDDDDDEVKFDDEDDDNDDDKSEGLHEIAMAAFESQYIDRDTYSASAKDIEVQSYFFDDQQTSLSPPKNWIPPDVLLRESRQLALSESEKAVSLKPVSFRYQRPMQMVSLRYRKIRLTAVRCFSVGCA